MSDEVSVHENTSNEALVNEAHRLAGGATNAVIAARQMEMTRRLIRALEASQRSADAWAKRLVILTAVLVVFTATLIAVAIESAYLTWVLLERGG